MRRSVLSLLSLFSYSVFFILAACAPRQLETSIQETQAAANEITARIGFTSSSSGNFKLESTQQANGIRLWMEHINQAGGIELSNGSVVKFDSKDYDDEADRARVEALYTRLISEDKTDFLISPYSSTLADSAAVIAEQYGRVMIAAGAALDGVFQKGYTLVYQTYTPASQYLTGALELLKQVDPQASDIAIIYESGQFSSFVSNGLKEYAEAQGYRVVLFEDYPPGTTDFSPIISKIEEAAPDAILGGGHVPDGSAFVEQLYENEVRARFIALLQAPLEPSFAGLGEAAFGIIGPSQWEPVAEIDQAAVEKKSLEWAGPSNATFITAYRDKYGEEPSYQAAGGYASGLILQQAIVAAGSLDTQAVKAALDNLDMMTFFGQIKFDNHAENHGMQSCHSMVYIQWQRDAAGHLVKRKIWPAPADAPQIVYPIR